MVCRLFSYQSTPSRGVSLSYQVRYPFLDNIQNTGVYIMFCGILLFTTVYDSRNISIIQFQKNVSFHFTIILIPMYIFNTMHKTNKETNDCHLNCLQATTTYAVNCLQTTNYLPMMVPSDSVKDSVTFFGSFCFLTDFASCSYYTMITISQICI